MPASSAQLQLAFGQETTRFCVLGSGSSGNCLIVESGDSRILVDVGFSCREVERRLDSVGISSRHFDGVVLTHEHGDHSRGAARFSRRHRVPIYATRGTLSCLRLPSTLPKPVIIEPPTPFSVGDFLIEAFAIPHDASEPVGLVIECDGGRLGLAADLGQRPERTWRRLRDLDALVLETNHDLEMLRSGPYPWPLKERIASENGHLSNRDAAEGLREILSERLRWLVLYHLSRTNNLPALARDAVTQVLARTVTQAEVFVSEQSRPTPWITLEETVAAT